MAATKKATSNPAPDFLTILPLEIRLTIYGFVLPRLEWTMVDEEEFEQNGFPRGMGDPSGFYNPSSRPSSILQVNKQIRREALPLAYRYTEFRLDNLESAIKFLVAAGQIGRENMQTLHLTWESVLEPTNNWVLSPDRRLEQLPRKLPSWSASTFLQLLKQCEQLRYLSLQFDSDLIQEIGFDAFKDDANMQGLCTLRDLRRVDIQQFGTVNSECSSLAEWFREQMTGTLKQHEQQVESSDRFSDSIRCLGASGIQEMPTTFVYSRKFPWLSSLPSVLHIQCLDHKALLVMNQAQEFVVVLIFSSIGNCAVWTSSCPCGSLGTLPRVRLASLASFEQEDHVGSHDAIVRLTDVPPCCIPSSVAV